jgi:hypothetical protein
MKLSSLLSGIMFACVVVVVLLLILGVNFQRPIPAQGAALYDPATEISVTGVVTEVSDFACPVSEGEVGNHLMLKAADRTIQVHLAPSRIMRGQHLVFERGEQLTVVGSQVRTLGKNDLIAREISRGNETIIFRDPTGKLIITQW